MTGAESRLIGARLGAGREADVHAWTSDPAGESRGEAEHCGL
jgi:hypothetical protein